MRVRVKAIPWFLLALVFASCAGTTPAFRAAQQADTIDAYQRFLEEHPAGDEAARAGQRISELQYRDARALDTIDAYQEFLRNNRHGGMADSARARIVQIHFAAAEEEGTIEALRSFLRANPDAPQADTARQEIDSRYEQRYQQVVAQDTEPAYRRFLRLHPPQELASKTAIRLQTFEQQAVRGVAAAHRTDDSLLVLPTVMPKEDGERYSFTIAEGGSEFGLDIIELRAELPDDVFPQRKEGRIRFDHGTTGTRSGGTVEHGEGWEPGHGRIRINYPLGVTGRMPRPRIPSVGSDQYGAMPLGPGSVVRFIGHVSFDNYTFDGDPDDPLVFILLSGQGMAYVKGHGKVKGMAGSMELPRGQ